jgi:hypothetical protein
LLEATMSIPAEKVIQSFVEKINHADLLGLTPLLSTDHTFIDLEGDKFIGKDKMIEGWRDYFSENPDYKIYIRMLYKLRETVILIGHTTGSHLNLPDIVEFHSEGVIWIAEVSKGQVTSWQILQDTQENFNRLGLDHYSKLFNPTLYARTIAKHLDLLPPGARTQDVRNVRILYSRLYEDADPEDLLLLAEQLIFEEGYRFVPYELITHHPGAIEKLSPERALALGKGIHDGSSADIFAQFILAPAWKKHIVTDEHIDQWFTSGDVWQRRAALVSTIYLDGDIERMLHYAERLLDDHEDLIIKALSWVLRSAIKIDKDAVLNFLEAHEGRLNSRIRREVRNKETMGVKIL